MKRRLMGYWRYVFPKSLYENTEAGFKLMNSALKTLAEKDTLRNLKNNLNIKQK
jgi:hypothetical protein